MPISVAYPMEDLPFHLFYVRWHSSDSNDSKAGIVNARLCREAALAFAEYAELITGEIIVDRLPPPTCSVYACDGLFQVSDAFELENGILYQRDGYDDFEGELSLESYPI